MPIQIRCASCSYGARVKDSLAGKRVACPQCGEPIDVVETSQQPTSVKVTRPARRQQSQRPPATAAEPPTRKAAWLVPALGGAGVILLAVVIYAAFSFGKQSAEPTSPSPPPGAQIVAQPESPVHPAANRTGKTRRAAASNSAAAQPIEESAPADPPKPTSPAQEVAKAKLDVPTIPQQAAVPVGQETAQVQENEHPLTNTVDFEKLVLDYLVTSMDMTEDGRYLVLTHQADNQVSFYNVLQRKVAASVTAVAPRSVLCRSGFAFVANYGKGTISVYSRDKEWQLVNELQVNKPNVMYVSAPGGRNFKGELIVTCHGDGPQASYQDSHVFAVSMKTDQCRPISRAAMATVSYDGKLVMTQGSFNLSPSGGLAAYNYKEYVNSGDKAQPIFKGGIQQTPFVYQVDAGGYWIGNNIVFGGVPIVQLEGDLGQLVVPDLSQKLIYSLTRDVVRAHRLNSGLTELGTRRSSYPAEYDEFSKVYHHLYRMRGYLLDHSTAYTHGDRLFLFVLPAKGGKVLAAETRAFEANTTPSPRPRTDIADTPDTPAGPAEPLAGLLNGFPKMIPAGREFRFQFKMPPQTSLELMSEIPGMVLTRQGDLRWKPTEKDVGRHELKIRITQNGQNSFERPQLEVIDEELFASLDGDLSKLNEFEHLDLEVDRYAIADGNNGDHLLLLQGDILRILGGDGIAVKDQRKLPNRYDFIEERADTYIAVTKNPAPALDVIDKRNLRIRRHIDLTSAGTRILEITDLAINPRSKDSFVAIKHDIDLPRYTVLTVDEGSGRVESPGILGTWVEVSPDGKRLYTGYKDIYQRGSRFHINPGWNLIEVPEYGNVDMLLAWETRKYDLKQAILQAGGNGNGIRLSADGKRLTYLSHVGYPRHSGNLVGVDAEDLGKPAVSYEYKGRGVTTELAYHPTLPLVAVPGSGSAVLFHRETGEPLENRLLLPASGLGDSKVERLFFSPNGDNLVFLCSGGDTGRYLRSVRLKLAPRERLAKAARRPAAPTPSQPKPEKVPREELHGLRPPNKTDPITAKEIGRRYLDAVVLVLTEDSSGSGFFIGKTGYLLTSAHVVEGAADHELRVVYNSKPGGEKYEPLRVAAKVVRVDDRRDLALLKVRTPKNPVHIFLAEEERVETGETVTVIGNPGLGTEILNRTMTSGIVSNPDRELNGQHYVQMSAAINPGNSGGPMFDTRGHVIGLVSSKGNIDGAGFAVPARVVRDFLDGAVDGN